MLDFKQMSRADIADPLPTGRIRDESSVHALRIKEVDTRIESEIAGLRTSIQSAKFNVLQVSTRLSICSARQLSDRRYLRHSVLGWCSDGCWSSAPCLSQDVPVDTPLFQDGIEALSFTKLMAVGRRHRWCAVSGTRSLM